MEKAETKASPGRCPVRPMQTDLTGVCATCGLELFRGIGQSKRLLARSSHEVAIGIQPGARGEGQVDVWGLTRLFFVLYFLMATQVCVG